MFAVVVNDFSRYSTGSSFFILRYIIMDNFDVIKSYDINGNLRCCCLKCRHVFYREQNDILDV